MPNPNPNPNPNPKPNPNQVHSSLGVHAQVDAFLARIGAAAASEVATLHVRRGDTTDRCNTSVPAVLEYIACALPEGEAAPPHRRSLENERGRCPVPPC